jgi:transposase-like protein
MGLDNIELMAMGLAGWPTELSGPLYDGLSEVVTRARTIATDFRARAEELQKSGDLTSSGVAKQLDLLANQELNRLDSLAATALGRSRRDLDLFNEKLAAVNTPPADSAAQAIALAETRGLLMDLPESERITTLSEALTAGDTLVLRAVFLAPSFWRRRFAVPAELLEDWRRRWQEQADPTLFVKARDLTAAITKTVNAVKGARMVIAETGGLSEAARTSLAQKIQEDPLN